MPDAHHLLLFIGAGLLLNLTPGPDIFYILSHSLRQGARGGLVAALGICLGCCVHVLAATAGVSAVLAASSAAFNLLKWLGAAYLAWIGVRMLLSVLRQPVVGRSALAHELRTAGPQPGPGLAAIFRRGFLTNVLNPKVALFFLAFVPQFIAPGTPAGERPWVFLALGLLFTFNSLWVCAGWAVLAAWAARRTRALQAALRWLDGVAGGIFIAFAARLVMSEAPGPA